MECNECWWTMIYLANYNVINNNNNICICIAPLPTDTKRCCLYVTHHNKRGHLPDEIGTTPFKLQAFWDQWEHKPILQSYFSSLWEMGVLHTQLVSGFYHQVWSYYHQACRKEGNDQFLHYGLKEPSLSLCSFWKESVNPWWQNHKRQHNSWYRDLL